jgi:L,D-peptidoglycan transpeptidase YkuD (ErfK/YbiS/YcfS/YnhG family)
MSATATFIFAAFSRKTRAVRRPTLRGLSRAATQGKLCLGHLSLRCALGRGGRRPKRREGDGITPLGRWPVREVLYRADRLKRPKTGLPTRPIRPGDGWCDDPADRNYNRKVALPFPRSHEGLWRKDHLYDIVVVLGYNDRPRSRGRGSAIFMHLARPDYGPTAGCIALSRGDMLKLLARLRPGDRVVVP